jgi:hypothetical protein
MAALEKHIVEMSSNSLFEGTDFKLASCDDPVDERVARECGFTSLSVRVVKVLVSLSPTTISPFNSVLRVDEFSIVRCCCIGRNWLLCVPTQHWHPRRS